MAPIAAMVFGGRAWWQGPVLLGRSSEEVRCARSRKSSAEGKGCNLEEELSPSFSVAVDAGRCAFSFRGGGRTKNFVSSTMDDGALGNPRTRNFSSAERKSRRFVTERVGDYVLEQCCISSSNNVYEQQNSPGGHQRRDTIDNLFRQHGRGQQISLISTPVEETIKDSLSQVGVGERGEESASRSGRRRAFTSIFLMGFATFSIAGDAGEVLAEAQTRPPKAKTKGRVPSSPYDEDRLLEQNRRMQRLNNAPSEFPGFVREGFQVKVIINDKYVTSKSGLIYYDMVVGGGDLPQDGQQVIFHYTGYNESGRRVDSSYQQGRPARTRLGIQGMIPGFEEGIKSMRAGGRRIIIVPPELGPPVGPSTFFSAKQFEVFDVELLEAKDCSRRTLLFYSDVVCE